MSPAEAPSAFVYLSGRFLGILPVPIEALLGRSSAEGLEVYVVVGSDTTPMASAGARLAFDHGFPPADSDP